MVPAERGDEATQDVAAILAGITFPVVEPFTGSDVLLAGLPGFMAFPAPDPEPPSRAGLARAVIASGLTALTAVRGLENTLAACKAALVLRVAGAVAVESAATDLTCYQTQLAHTGCVAEIAAALQIPERSAAALAAHAEGLAVHPVTRAALTGGSLSWRHVCTVLQELDTLAETPAVTDGQAACFEGELLRLAQGTTASRFAGKARRARESLFPESLEARTKEAFRNRRISNDPGKDGMNWLSLHLPTLAANAIMVHCTRTARALKMQAAERQRDANARGTGEDCREYRTLDQLRADIAAILLMGQQSTATPAGDMARGGNTTPQDDADADVGSTSADATPDDQEPPWAHKGTGPQRSEGLEKVPEAVPKSDLEAVPKSDLEAGPESGSEAGDGFGWVDGIIDGIAEHPQREYLEQLRVLGQHKVLADPPLPKALVLITVPLLGLLGLTHEPAQLDDSTAGPVPPGIARKLLAGSSTFLRVLTDPWTGKCLPVQPGRYTLREAERSVLQAMAGGCYFPNCTNPVLDTELDHVRSFASGGLSTMENLRPACRRHHHLKHFKDDRDRLGNARRWAEPWRDGLRLHGWTPHPQGDGTVAWESPSGTTCLPEYIQPQRPAYPMWLRRQLKKTRRLHGAMLSRHRLN